MHNENENYEGNKVIQFEDLFKDELKKKEQREPSEQSKKRSIFAVLYYVLIMFLIAGVVQLIFIQNSDNIHYFSADEIVLNELVNDQNGIGIVDASAYDLEFADVYDNYLLEIERDGQFVMLYNNMNAYITNGYQFPADAFDSMINNGLTTHWDEANLVPINYHISNEYNYALINSNIYDQVSYVSFERTILDEVINYPSEIGIVDADLYNKLYSNYSTDLTTINYGNFVAVFNKDNPTPSYQNFDQFDQILNGEITTWTNGDLITIVTYNNQTLPYIDRASVDIYPIGAIDWDFTNYASGLLNFIIYLLLLPVIIIILKPNLKYDFEITKKTEPFNIIKYVVYGYIFLIFMNFASSIVSSLLSSLFNQPEEISVNQFSIEMILHSNGAVFMVLSAVLMGPIVEELIFRKGMFSLFKNKWVALVLSSLLFGSIHLIGEASFADAIVNGVSYILMGFVFGLIYIKTEKNILIPILVHVLSNLLSILAILYM